MYSSEDSPRKSVTRRWSRSSVATRAHLEDEKRQAQALLEFEQAASRQAAGVLAARRRLSKELLDTAKDASDDEDADFERRQAASVLAARRRFSKELYQMEDPETGRRPSKQNYTVTDAPTSRRQSKEVRTVELNDSTTASSDKESPAERIWRSRRPSKEGIKHDVAGDPHEDFDPRSFTESRLRTEARRISKELRAEDFEDNRAPTEKFTPLRRLSKDMDVGARKLDDALDRMDAAGSLSAEHRTKARMAAVCSMSTEDDKAKARKSLVTKARRTSKDMSASTCTTSAEDRSNPQWSIDTLHGVLANLPQTEGSWTPMQIRSMAHAVSGIQQMLAQLEQTPYQGSSRQGSRRPSKDLSTIDYNPVSLLSPVETNRSGSEIWDPYRAATAA